MNSQIERIFDLSGGIQTATTWPLRKVNEVEDIENGRLNDEIGGITRRNGYTLQKLILSGKTGLGFHEAKFDGGSKIFVAHNNAGDTNTVIQYYDSGAGTLTDVITTLPANCKLQFLDHLSELYVAGITTGGTRIQPLNIKEDLTVSTTRNLFGAPKAAFVGENSGKLYLMNVELSSVVYADRAYESSPPMGAITYVKAAQVMNSTNGTSIVPLNVDTTRYLKVGMGVSIYAKGTDTLLYSFTITAVDKALETISWLPDQLTVAQGAGTVNTATEVITVASNTWMTTGTPITYVSTTPIGGLTSGTTYYVINVSSTTIKLATTAANAAAGTAIDLTSAGSGTGYFSRNYPVADNDEIWLTGRKADLSVLWNTDYRTPQTADYLRIPPGVASDRSITGWVKSNNRLNIFTLTSMHQYDNANFLPVFQDIGCAAHDTIRNINTWVIWLDATGKVRARDSVSGQDEIISRPVRNKYISLVPGANFLTATASMYDNIYKINFGQIGTKYMRLAYDFDANLWWRETHTRMMTKHIISRISGRDRLYFLDNNGNMYLDDEGNLDDTDTIPFNVTLGRRNFGTEQIKNLHGLYVYGDKITGATLFIMPTDVNRSPTWVAVGTLIEPITRIPLGDRNPYRARDFNFKISLNSKGDAPKIEGLSLYYGLEEDNFG